MPGFQYVLRWKFKIMKKHLLFAFVAAILPSLASAQLLDTVRIQNTGFDGPVAISTDDAEQLNNMIDKLYDDDLDMGWEGDEFNVLIAGLRFRGIQVPQGAVIDSAFVEIYAHEDEGDPSLVTIRGEASDNAVTYNDVDLISARPATTASIFWQITEDWTIWNKYRSPDVKNIIQEIVNRPGWQSGNALALTFTGQDQGATSDDNARDFEAFENVADPDDGGDGLNHPERIPKLYIYYKLASGITNIVKVTPLSVAPNPVTEGTMVLNTAPFRGQDAMIILSDMNGRIVKQWSENNLQVDVLSLETGVLPQGTYNLEVRTARETSVAKVVFIR